MASTTNALDLGRRLAALPEAGMRRQVLRQVIVQLPDEEAVSLMGELSRRGRDTPGIEVAVLALATVLEHEDLGYERHAALYDAAKQAGDQLVLRLLLTAGSQPGTWRRQLGEPPVEPSAPLGWRKAWAREPRRDRIDRLLFDPDASVLEILLQNPRVLERDAVALAARRPTTRAAQRAVFGSRYAARQEVRRALVFNPYTPVEMSARLLPALSLPDISDVARSTELAPPLREEAWALLRARRAG